MSDLLDQLRGGREAAASGALAFDRAKAREKLQKFRLPDPHHYVLQFVRAASVSGASRISFTVEPTSMECMFDRELPEELLRNLWDHAFGERATHEQQAAYYLALGLGSAQALNPQFIEVTSGGVRLTIEQDTEEVIAAEERRAAWSGRTRIRLREKFSLGQVSDFLQSIFGELNEVRALRTYCEYAAIELVVNGENVASPLDDFKFDRRFDMREGRLRMAIDLQPNGQDDQLGRDVANSWLVLLRDGVKLAEWAAPGHGARYIAALDSPLLATDLSGVKLVEDRGIERKLVDIVTEHHLSMLADWVEGELPLPEVPEEVVIHLLQKVGRRVSFLNREKLPVGEGTQRLYDWLTAQPMFEAIDGTGTPPAAGGTLYSARELMREGKLLYTRTTFRDVVLPGRIVADLSHARWDASARHDSLVVLHGIDGLRVVDAESQLAEQAKYDRNREQWSRQPVTGMSSYSLAREVEVGSYRGRVQVPTIGVGHPLDESQVGLRVYLEGRLLRSHELLLPLPLLVEIDGDFEVDAIHADIVAHPDLERLCEEIVCAVPALVDAVAEAAVRQDRALWGGFVSSWLEVVLSGTWYPNGGWTEQSYREWTEQSYRDGRAVFELSCAFWEAEPPGHERDLRHLVEHLGPVANVRQFEVLGSSRLESLRSLVESGRATIPVLAKELRWRDHLEIAKANDVGFVVLASPELSEILIAFDSLFVDARPVLTRLAAERRFSKKPLYNRTGKVLAEAVSEEQSLRVELELLDSHANRNLGFRQAEGTLTVDVLYKGRLLERQSVGVSSSGTFRAVVSGDVRPRDDYDGSEAMSRALSMAKAGADRLLEEWWVGVVERQDISDGAFSLFMQHTVAIAANYRSVGLLPGLEDYRTTPTLPVWNVSGDVSWMSFQELEAAIEEADHTLRYVTGGTLPPGVSPSSSPILVLGDHIGLEQLHAAFPTAALVDARKDDAITLSPAQRRFMSQPPMMFTVLGAGPIWSGRYEGVELYIRWVPDESSNKPSRIEGQVLWEGRPLEQIVLDAPLGNFRFIAQSKWFEPDSQYSALGVGRERLEEALRLGVTQCVVQVVNRFDEMERYHDLRRVVGGGSPDLAELVRRDLLLGMARLNEFDEEWDVLAEVVRRARVFRTAAGHFLNRAELEVISTGGVVEATDEGVGDDVLRISRFLPAYRAALRGHYVIEYLDAWKLDLRGSRVGDTEEPAGRDDTASDMDEQAIDERALPPLLSSVRRKLLEVRGPRQDLLGDGLLTGWSTGDRAAPDDLVKIDKSHLTLETAHPLWTRFEQSPDELALSVLTSVIFTSVNRHFVEVTDHHDAEFQALLLSSHRRTREASDG